MNEIVFKYSKSDLTFGRTRLKREWLIYSLPDQKYNVLGRFVGFSENCHCISVNELIGEFKTYNESINCVKKLLGIERKKR